MEDSVADFNLETSEYAVDVGESAFACTDRMLGRGAFGVVYQARLDGKAVAAKQLFCFINPNIYGITNRRTLLASPLLSEITRELSSLLLLDHENIVKCTGFIPKQLYGVTVPHYILLEFVNGVTLETAMADIDRMTEYNIISITRQVASALVYIHSLDLIHRDLKPQNIMVTRANMVKVCDFGIAKVRDPATQTYIGTPAYCAPEVMTGHYASPVDVYSLGCTMLAMLRGSHTAGHHEERVRSIERLVDESEAIVSIVRQCLSTAPQHRPKAARLAQLLADM